MVVASFQDVIWNTSDVADKAKLNLMSQNTRYLLERMPKLYYNAYNVKKDTGVKIACGVVAIPPNKGMEATVTVNFGSFFSAGTRPIPVTSLTTQTNMRIIETTYGFGGLGSVPDHRGFHCRIATVEVYQASKTISKTAWLNWICMGY